MSDYDKRMSRAIGAMDNRNRRTKIDWLRERHPTFYEPDDVAWLLELAIQADRLWRSDHRVIDLSDTALDAINKLYAMLNEEAPSSTI